MQSEKENWSEIEVVKRNPKGEHHCDIMGLNELKINRPTVICFSGNGTVDLKDTNGICKQAESYLELLVKDRNNNSHITDYVDIVGIKYLRNRETSTTGQFPNKEAMSFVKNTMLPRFKVNCKRLSVDDACKQMSQVVFFTYCAGAEVANRVVSQLNYELYKLGYTKSEVQKINESTMHISFAPFDCIHNYVPSVRILSTKDDMIGDDLRYMLSETEIDKFDGVELIQEKPGRLYSVKRDYAPAGNINIISGQLLNGIFSYRDEHNLGILSRDKKWEIRKTEDKSSPNADCVSQMMAWALSRAVENSLKNQVSDKFIPNTFYTELMDELQSIKDSFGKSELLANKEYKMTERGRKFEELRKREITRRAKLMTDYKPEFTQVDAELKNAHFYKEILLLCYKYNFHYADAILAKSIAPNQSERQIIKVLAEEYAKEREGKIDRPSLDVPIEKQLVQSLNEQTDFEGVVRVFNKFGFQYVSDFIHEIKSVTLFSEQIKALMLTAIVNSYKDGARNDLIEFDTYTQMIKTINNSDNFGDVLNYLKKHDFVGVEYLMQEDLILTDKEKKIILREGAKRQKQQSDFSAM